MRRLAIQLLALTVALPWFTELATGADDLIELEQRAVTAAVRHVAPSVVSIETVGGMERVGGALVGSGPATGTIVSSDGYIVSSAFHFIQKPASILVTLADGTRLPATLTATDRNRMLVLLRVRAGQALPVPEPVAESSLRVGQWAIAVGRTFDRTQPNLSVGIISGLNRIWGKAVQTDARISPSNYGGPLIDIHGRVIGILVPLAPDKSGELAGTDWYDSQIGFAVPIEQVLAVVPRLKRGQDLQPGVAGITLGSGDLFGEPPVVSAARPNSPAAKAGLRAGDKVVAIDGVRVTSRAELSRQINPHYAGDMLHISVERGGERLDLPVTLADAIDPYRRPFLGILPRRLAGDAATSVMVRYVYPNGPAAKAGMEAGDRIMALNGREVADAAELAERLASLAVGDTVKLAVKRGDESLDLNAKLATEPEDVPAQLPAEPLDAGAVVLPPPGDAPRTGSFTTTVGEYKNECRVYVPKDYDPAQSYGLLVWLHGDEPLKLERFVNRWAAAADRDRFIVVAPQGADEKDWSIRDLEFLSAAVAHFAEAFRVDPLRIAACGEQVGGSLACLLAYNDRERIRGVAAIQAPLAGGPDENDPEHRLAFYVACSPQLENGAAIDRIRKLRYPVTQRALGEKATRLNDDEQAELLRWFDTLDKL